MGIAVHVILTATADHVPLSTIGDAVVVVGHIVRVDLMALVGVFVADELVPGIIGMEGIGVVPRIVHHFGTTVVVGSHHKGDFSGKVHEPLGFSLVFVAIRVGTAMRIGIVTVHVDAVGVLSSGTVDGVVATMIGAVGIGIGANVKIDIIHHVLHLRLVGILQQIIDEAEHHDPTCGLVTMDSAGVEELRLAVGRAIVEVGNQNLATAVQCAEGDDFALVGVVGGELEHHVLVGAIGGIAVPVVFGTVAAVPHGHYLAE